MGEYIWQNGEFKSWQDATVHVLTHSLHHGTAAIEGIRFYKVDGGAAIYRLQDHLDRLYFSAKVLGMEVSIAKNELAKNICQLILKNQLQEGYIRPLIYYGAGGMRISADDNPVEVVIATWPWGKYLDHDAVDVKVSRFCHVDSRSGVPGAKLTGSYVNGLVASLEIRNTHYHEVLMLDTNGFITEGVGENIFLVKNRCLYTPDEGILPGITRDTVCQLADDFNFDVVKKKLTLHDVFNADEAFFTGTAVEVVPIKTIDDQKIGECNTYPVASFFKAEYQKLIRGQNSKYSQHLTLVSFLSTPK